MAIINWQLELKKTRSVIRLYGRVFVTSSFMLGLYASQWPAFGRYLRNIGDLGFDHLAQFARLSATICTSANTSPSTVVHDHKNYDFIPINHGGLRSTSFSVIKPPHRARFHRTTMFWPTNPPRNSPTNSVLRSSPPQTPVVTGMHVMLLSFVRQQTSQKTL